MNVGTLKSLAYLASTALFAGMAYIGYEFFTSDLERMSRPADLSHTVGVLEGVEAPEPPRETGLDYTATIKPAVIGFDWTGAPPPPPPPPKGPEEDEEEGAVAYTPVDQMVMVLGVFGISAMRPTSRSPSRCSRCSARAARSRARPRRPTGAGETPGPGAGTTVRGAGPARSPARRRPRSPRAARS